MTVQLQKTIPASAISITVVDGARFAQLAPTLPAATRQWLQTVGFTGTPDSHALVPDAQDPSYIVALNLISRSPTWLTALHAQPMYLGLDLRGGERTATVKLRDAGANMGAGTGADAGTGGERAPAAPAIERFDLAFADPGVVPLLRAADDSAIGGWRAFALRGAGRDLAVGLAPAVHRCGVQVHVVEAICSGVHETSGQRGPYAGIWRPVTS